MKLNAQIVETRFKSSMVPGELVTLLVTLRSLLLQNLKEREP